jgi:AcrR family transcriptional regulator
MPPDRSSAGDPARTLALLWRDADRRAPARGPRPGLSVDRVVDAAVELADRDGLAAVTVRRVAEALGIAPMSVYTYVPGKAELLDLMLDTVYARMDRADHGDRPWRARVEAVARENLALYRRHPWVAAVSTVRPPLGPGLIAKYVS